MLCKLVSFLEKSANCSVKCRMHSAQQQRTTVHSRKESLCKFQQHEHSNEFPFTQISWHTLLIRVESGIIITAPHFNSIKNIHFELCIRISYLQSNWNSIPCVLTAQYCTLIIISANQSDEREQHQRSTYTIVRHIMYLPRMCVLTIKDCRRFSHIKPIERCNTRHVWNTQWT